MVNTYGEPISSLTEASVNYCWDTLKSRGRRHAVVNYDIKTHVCAAQAKKKIVIISIAATTLH
jgi:hypothetical protein